MIESRVYEIEMPRELRRLRGVTGEWGLAILTSDDVISLLSRIAKPYAALGRKRFPSKGCARGGRKSYGAAWETEDGLPRGVLASSTYRSSQGTDVEQQDSLSSY